jgi:hypothetical protein
LWLSSPQMLHSLVYEGVLAVCDGGAVNQVRDSVEGLWVGLPVSLRRAVLVELLLLLSSPQKGSRRFVLLRVEDARVDYWVRK